VVNKEGLDRTTSPKLLPWEDGPKLVGVNGAGEGPELVVVGHDPETFVRMGMELMGTPRVLSEITNRCVFFSLLFFFLFLCFFLC